MAGGGTGTPIHLRCHRARKFNSTHDGFKLVRTGRVRPIYGRSRGIGWPRTLVSEQHEYECLECGHVGWTRHKRILDMPLRAPTASSPPR